MDLLKRSKTLALLLTVFIGALVVVAPMAYAAGTIQIIQGGPGAGNNPQKGACQFDVRFTNFDGVTGATITASLQSPTSGTLNFSQNVTLSGGPEDQLAAVDLGPAIHASGVPPKTTGGDKGWHVKVEAEADDGTSSQKTVWVDGCVADLSVVKTTNTSPIFVGNNTSFNLAVTNSGPSDVVATVTDTLPAALEFVSSNPGSPTCTASGQILTCNIAVAAGDTENITVTAKGLDTGTHTNNVSVTSSAFDPNTGNNSSSSQVTVNAVPAPILAIAKTPATGTVRQGSNYTFTIKVTNSGNADANDVTVTDTLPSELTLVEVTWPSGSDPACTSTDLSCNIGTITQKTGGVDGEKTISVEVTGTDLGTHTNTAKIGTNGPQATATLSVVAPDLKVTKSSNKTEILKGGEQVTFTIDIKNNGDADALNVSFEDVLPSELTFDSSTPTAPDCTYDAGDHKVTCADLGTIAVGDTKTVKVFATGNATGTHTNTASASTTGDSDTSDNSDDANVKVTMFDLEVTKTRTSASPINIGDQANFSIEVKNTGDADATGVEVTDTIPAGLTLSSIPAGCAYAAPVLTCSLGTLAPGATETINLTTTANSLGTHENVAVVTPTDDTPANNTSKADVLVVTAFIPPPPSADLSITKTDQVDPVQAGENINYTLTVTNNGPDAAANVTVSDALPAGLGFVSATPSQGSCNSTSPISCSLGTVANGQTVTVLVVASTTSATPGTVVNTATVGSTTGDPKTGDNEDSEDTTVTPLPPEKGRIVVEKLTVPAGSSETFTFAGDAAGTLSHGQTMAFDVDAGTYTSTEAEKTGWVLTGIECDDMDSSGSVATATATFNVDEGETVKCTFTNLQEEVLPKPPIKDPVQPDPDDPDEPKKRDQVKGGALPFTGGGVSGLITFGLLLLLSGATVVFGARRQLRPEISRRR